MAGGTQILNGASAGAAAEQQASQGGGNIVNPSSIPPSTPSSILGTALYEDFWQNNRLLVPGDGIAGADNNTFYDSSDYHYPITRNGSVGQGIASPCLPGLGYYSIFYRSPSNTTGYSITAPNILPQPLATLENWSLECWVKDSTGGALFALFGTFPNVGIGTTRFYFAASSGGITSQPGPTGSSFNVGGVSNVADGNWHHIWITLDTTGFWRCYFDGRQVGTGAQFYNSSSQVTSIGFFQSGDVNRAGWNGRISNLRITRGGSFLYDLNGFTPPTEPLTATANTQLLTFQGPYPKDFSQNNYNVAPLYTIVSTSSDNPFAVPGNAAAVYNSTTTSGSASFDGMSSYLSLTPDANLALPTTTTPFTVETWYKPTDSSGGAILSLYDSTSNRVPLAIGINSNTVQLGGTLASVGRPWVGYFDGNQWSGVFAGANINNNSWTHIAAVYNGTNTRIFINGANSTVVGTPNRAPNAWITDTSTDLFIGKRWNANSTQFYSGYLSDTRIVIGNAIYTSNFTPSLTALTAVNNTKLLLNYANSGIIDTTGKNILTTTNVSLSADQIKYGNTSLYFNGANSEITFFVDDFLMYQRSNSVPFTLDAWVYPQDVGKNESVIFGMWPNSTVNINFGYPWALTHNSASGNQTVTFRYATSNTANAVITTSVNSVPNNTWTHIAVNRNDSGLSIYTNGNLSGNVINGPGGTGTTALLGFNSSNSVVYGSIGNANIRANTNLCFTGYMQGVRYGQDITRYNYSFVPPTGPWNNYYTTQPLNPSPDIFASYNRLLLTGQGTNNGENNQFLDSSNNNLTINVVGTDGNRVGQGSYGPMSGTGWSGFFNGGYLTTPNVANLNMEGSDFTMECWLMPATTSITANSHVLTKRTASASIQGTVLGFDIAGLRPTFKVTTNGSTYNANILSNIRVEPFAWNHIAGTRSGNTFTLWVNGANAGANSAATGNIPFNTANFTIGAGSGNGTQVITSQSCISDVRVVKGNAIYTSNFTPPTVALTAVTNTSLLTLNNNRFVDSSGANLVLTRSSGVVVIPVSPYPPGSDYDPVFNGGSAYFDGSGQLTVASNTVLEMEGSDFTQEMWVWPVSNGAATVGSGLITMKEGNTDIRGTQIVFPPTLLQPQVFATINNSTWAVNMTSSVPCQLYQWNHIAYTRSGDTFRVFVNGQQGNSTNVSGNIAVSSSNLIVGAGSSLGNAPFVNGHITDVRIVKGNALYTGNFTVPTAPLTAVDNTSVLLNFINSSIYDSTQKTQILTQNDAKLTNAANRWGTGTSLYFSGDSGNGLLNFNSTASYVTTIAPVYGLRGDYTIEGWFYQTANSTGAGLVGMNINPATGAGGLLFRSNVDSWTSGLISTISITGVAANYSLSAGTAGNNRIDSWHHYAVTRNNGVVRNFVDGVYAGVTTTTTTTNYLGPTGYNAHTIGSYFNSSAPVFPFTGYGSDIRITVGRARYWQSFTPPDGPFPTS